MNDLDELHGLIWSYRQTKESMENYKREVDDKGVKIKQIMQSHNLESFNTIDGLTAKIVIQKRESFNEPSLIAKLKELGVTSPIKTIEVVDMDELENVIYNHKLDASEITNCKQTKEVVTLRVSEKKGE